MKLVRMPVLGLVATTAAFAAATWLVGWWTVPVLAAIVVALFGRRDTVPPAPSDIALAAVLGWGALLALQARAPGFGELLSAVGGVLRVGRAGLLLATLAFAGLLAWSAAALVAGLVGRRAARVRAGTFSHHRDSHGTRRERERVAGR